MFGFKKSHVLSVMLGAALVSSTQAAPPFSQLKIDFNNVKLTMSAALLAGGDSKFGGVDPYTGTMTFGMASTATSSWGADWEGNNSTIPATGPFFTAGSAGTLTTLSGSLSFDSGVLTGVDFAFTNDVGFGDEFSTDIASGGVLTYVAASLKYEVTGLTFSGLFVSAANSFFGPTDGSGVDISLFLANQAGSSAHGILKNFLIPEGIAALGSTEAVQAELFIVIPLPGAAGLAGFGLLALGVRRRRI